MSQKSKDWSEGDFIKCDDDSIYQWHNGKASPFKKPHTVPDWVPKGTPLTPEIPCPVHGPYPKDSVDTLPPGPPVVSSLTIIQLCKYSVFACSSVLAFPALGAFLRGRTILSTPTVHFFQVGRYLPNAFVSGLSAEDNSLSEPDMT